LNIIKCPVCGKKSEKKDKTYICVNHHSFDIAKQGYTNFLLNNDKKSKEPGDTKEMLNARKNFLDKGYYKFILEQVKNTIISDITDAQNKSVNLNVIDVGCGEGYYLSGMINDIDEAVKNTGAHYYGVDISKEGIKLSALRNENVEWFAANSFNLPFVDNCFDYIISMFSILDVKECSRVLKNNGKIIFVTAQKEHLKELKEIIYPVLTEKKYEAENLQGCDIIKSTDHLSKVMIESNNDLWNLLSMTPHFWKAEEKNKQLLNDHESLEITININIKVLRSR
jgi:23S rRNA (guanine745-N1)-methyltransferase